MSHASLVAYPSAVISLKDPKTGTILYVESDGRHLVALGADGMVVWDVDVIAEARAGPVVGQSVIRHLRLEGDDVFVTFGKSATAKVHVKTGKTDYTGSD